MITTNMIIGIVAAGLFVIVLLVAWYRNSWNVFAVVLALGIAAAGITVSVYRVQQYDEQQARAQSAPATIQANPTYGSSVPPEPPPRIVPRSPVPLSGASGAAAPEPVKIPALGGGR